MHSGYVAEQPLGYRQFTAGQIDASTLMTAVVGGAPNGWTQILIVPETQAIRWRDDGTAPTTTVGQPLPVGSELRYTARGNRDLRFIGQAVNAVLNLTFYGQ